MFLLCMVSGKEQMCGGSWYLLEWTLRSLVEEEEEEGKRMLRSLVEEEEEEEEGKRILGVVGCDIEETFLEI